MNAHILNFTTQRSGANRTGRWVDFVVTSREGLGFRFEADMCMRTEADELTLYRVTTALRQAASAPAILTLFRMICSSAFKPETEQLRLSKEPRDSASDELIGAVLAMSATYKILGFELTPEKSFEFEEKLARIDKYRRIQAFI